MSTYALSSLLGRKVSTTDGDVGAIDDVYFSDSEWCLEHVVVKTTSRYSGRRLLMNPELISTQNATPDATGSAAILLDATRDILLGCPDASADPPVVEQKAHHPRLYPYLLWMPTGDSTKLVQRPLGGAAEDLREDDAEAEAHGYNPHLRSLAEVRGYGVKVDGNDAKIGHIEDLIARQEDHQIVQILLRVRDGQGNHDIALAPEDVQHIDWSQVTVFLHRAPEGVVLPEQKVS